MHKTVFRSLVTVGCLLALCLLHTGCQTTGSSWRTDRSTTVSRVTGVPDSITLTLRSGDTVRLLGLLDPRSTESGATDFLRSQAHGSICTLEYEGTKRVDDEGRPLAYVYVEGQMLNRALLAKGYARVDGAASFSLKDEFLEIEAKAKKAKRGLWGVSAAKPVKKAVRKEIQPVVLPEPAPPAKPEVPKGPVIVPWGEAAKYEGKEVTVEGTIVGSYKAERVCFLNFHPDYERHFRAVIFDADLPEFPPVPATHYKGRKVRVTGMIDTYRGRPQMVLEYRDQIKIVE